MRASSRRWCDSPDSISTAFLASARASSLIQILSDLPRPGQVRTDGRLFGFLFFDSKQLGYFTPLTVERLAVFGHLLALILIHSLTPARMLHSALRVASRLTHYRDPETGAHLDRMSHYARLLAQALAPQQSMSDEFVEFLFLFAPAHDIGKIAVPDTILLKQGRLLEEEFEVMKTHVTKGAEIVDGIVRDLGLGAFPHIDVLRNVVLFHHEASTEAATEGRSVSGTTKTPATSRERATRSISSAKPPSHVVQEVHAAQRPQRS